MSYSPEKFIDYYDKCLENVEGFHELLSAIASIMRNPDEPIKQKVFICTDPTTCWLSHILNTMFPRGESFLVSAEQYLMSISEHASFVMIECSHVKSPKTLEVIIKTAASGNLVISRLHREAKRIPPNAVVVINFNGEMPPLEPVERRRCVILKRKPDEQPAVDPAELAEYLKTHID